MLAGLGEDLDSDIVGNEVLLNQGAQESVLCLGGGGKTNLYLLKPYLAEELEELHLFLQAHGDNQRLVHAAPDRRLFQVVLVDPFDGLVGGGVISDGVFFCVFHDGFCSFLCMVCWAGWTRR